MAVVKVFGSINNIELVFSLAEDGAWQSPVPSVADGKYIIDLYAEDDAGNISYYAKYLYTFDSANLVATFEQYLWQSDLLNVLYEITESILDYVANVQSEISTALVLSDYVSEVEVVA